LIVLLLMVISRGGWDVSATALAAVVVVFAVVVSASVVGVAPVAAAAGRSL
jgi:aspartokinase